jgi:uncharacterized protein
MGAVVGALFVYPVKSCRGIALDRAQVEPRGLRHDRRWMIVDGEGMMVTQRTQPTLAQVEVVVDEEQAALVLHAPGPGTLRLALAPRDGTAARVRIWSSEVEALDTGEEASRWASGLLGAPASVVFMPDQARRGINADYGRVGDVVSFADGFPMLVTSTASLDDLNARLDRPVPMNRFRPNLVVDGSSAWAEDQWKSARVGEVPVRLPKACDRCVITTTDQVTGERGVEPLRTLATFRKTGKKVYFGINAIPDAVGSIAVGDPFTVVESQG